MHVVNSYQCAGTQFDERDENMHCVLFAQSSGIAALSVAAFIVTVLQHTSVSILLRSFYVVFVFAPVVFVMDEVSDFSLCALCAKFNLRSYCKK